MKDATRTALLLGLLAVIGGVVIFDVLRKNAPADDVPTSDGLAVASERLAADEALVASETEWSQSLAEHERSWDGVLAMAVRADTPELAVADFRALLVDAARELGLEVVRTDLSVSREIEGVPAGLKRVHELEVRLTVASHDVAALHRYLDSAEHPPGLIATISALRIDGPGAAQALEEASATLTVKALGVTPAPRSQGGDA